MNALKSDCSQVFCDPQSCIKYRLEIIRCYEEAKIEHYVMIKQKAKLKTGFPESPKY